MKRYQVKALVRRASGAPREVTDTVIASTENAAMRIFGREHAAVAFRSVTDVTDADTGWAHVAFVQSNSEPDRAHEVRRRVSDGALGCSCKEYRFSKGEKGCHHLTALTAATGAATEQTVRVTTKRQTVETYTVVRRAISLGPLTMRGVGGGR